MINNNKDQLQIFSYSGLTKHVIMHTCLSCITSLGSQLQLASYSVLMMTYSYISQLYSQLVRWPAIQLCLQLHMMQLCIQLESTLLNTAASSMLNYRLSCSSLNNTANQLANYSYSLQSQDKHVTFHTVTNYIVGCSYHTVAMDTIQQLWLVKCSYLLFKPCLHNGCMATASQLESCMHHHGLMMVHASQLQFDQMHDRVKHIYNSCPQTTTNESVAIQQLAIYRN